MKNTLISFLIFLIFFTPTILQAQENKIQKAVIGTYEWEPYISIDKKHFGVASHIVKEAFALVDIEVEFVFKPWKRLLIESSNGIIDGISVWGGYDNWIDSHYGSDPLFTGDYVIWTKKGNDFNWKNPADLKGMTIGVLTGEEVPEQLKDSYEMEYLEVNEVGTYEQNFKKLLSNRIDLLAVNRDTGNIILNNLSEEDQQSLYVHPIPLRISFYRLLLNRKNADKSLILLDKFNTGLHILKSQGKLQEMLDASIRGEYN